MSEWVTLASVMFQPACGIDLFQRQAPRSFASLVRESPPELGVIPTPPALTGKTDAEGTLFLLSFPMNTAVPGLAANSLSGLPLHP